MTDRTCSGEGCERQFPDAALAAAKALADANGKDVALECTVCGAKSVVAGPSIASPAAPSSPAPVSVAPSPPVDEDVCAPFHGGADTSVEAFASVSSAVRGKVRKQVLDYVIQAGSNGATCDEVERALDLTHQSASARITELRKASRIYDSGLRRPTRSGRRARVYKVSVPLATVEDMVSA
jgi:hypothetical protein